MKTLTTFTLAFALMFAVGCKKKGAAGELESLKDEACACKTKECGDAVDKKLEAAMEQLGKGGEPDDDTAREVMGVMMEAGLCLSKLK